MFQFYRKNLVLGAVKLHLTLFIQLSKVYKCLVFLSSMVVFDDLDFFIIKSIYSAFDSGKEITTYKIAKEYDWGDENPKDDRFFNSKTNLVSYRLKKMKEEGFVDIEKNGDGKNVYNLIKENVILSKHKFPDGYKDAILVDCNGWCVFEV